MRDLFIDSPYVGECVEGDGVHVVVAVYGGV